MSKTSYSPQLYDLAVNSTEADVTGQPVLSADFDEAEIELTVDAAFDGEVVVYKSNKYFAPDVTQPISADNPYTQIGITDMSSKTYYDAQNPFIPSGAGTYNLNVDYVGARWIIACTRNRTAGTIEKMSITLFDNK